MTVATRTAVEVWRAQPETARARFAVEQFMHALRPAGFDCRQTEAYAGDAEWLLVWGPGNPERRDAIRTHVEAGGHAVALDLAYWNRDAKVRVTVDAPHPQQWVMKDTLPSTRWLADPAPVADAWNQAGPVIVAGIGKKASVQYGDAVGKWERMMSAACARRWPSRPVQYRAKPLIPDPRIDQGLKGASLVVTWHSNVAVDAIRNGIPAICVDGAAAAVCMAQLTDDDPKPLDTDLRNRFLQNLAWFQWKPSEALQAWGFLKDLIG